MELLRELVRKRRLFVLPIFQKKGNISCACYPIISGDVRCDDAGAGARKARLISTFRGSGGQWGIGAGREKKTF